MYVTAAHLFDEFSQINYQLRNHNTGSVADFRVTAAELVEADNMKCGIVHFRRGRWLGITLIDSLTMCIGHDVAFLLAANDFRGPSQPYLSIVETPSKGDEIHLVGYPGSHNQMNEVGVGTLDLSFDLTLVDSKGTIINCFPEGRDKCLAFYPCLETTATMLSGHSGGPVLNMASKGVVGVNSRSDGQDGYCVVSWLGKALDIPLHFDDTELHNGSGKAVSVGETTLRKLAQHGIVSII